MTAPNLIASVETHGLRLVRFVVSKARWSVRLRVAMDTGDALEVHLAGLKHKRASVGIDAAFASLKASLETLAVTNPKLALKLLGVWSKRATKFEYKAYLRESTKHFNNLAPTTRVVHYAETPGILEPA